jgi:glycogen operon protein
VSALAAGLPYPLGATPRDGGVNFAVASEHATHIDLCVFDDHGTERRLPLHERTGLIWHGFLPGAGAGLVYGFRADGPREPHRGRLFNPHKLLLDPYAREIVGRFDWSDLHYGYQVGHPDGHLSFDTRDNAAIALKARVAAPLPPSDVPSPRIAVSETVIYEAHVRGFSRLNPGVPGPLRGTYAGLAHPASVAHLKGLGITTVSLLPTHYALTERHLREHGLTNYWGYNTIGFFCPDPRLSSSPLDPTATRREFRAMVDALHAAGMEVMLDVVFNHTAEGDETGPTISFRGLDNALYYRLTGDDRGRHENWTGCGNTVNLHQPPVTRFVLDALRYWVTEYGVDGFRFDLGTILGRTAHAFDPHAPFFVALLQDPVLAPVKLVAEPWDIGPDGYQLGRFPARFMEWNDRYRDGVRRFWLQRGISRGEFARRLAGSSDRFQHSHRQPCASVNFITAHDGFTLTDLVSYSHRHNQANGEGNRDGHRANFSAHFGVEGPTSDPAINAQRARARRALLTTLLASQGTPMLLAGDEIGHSQRGNNNAYCQDNETTWLDWSRADHELLGYVRRLIDLRRRHPHLHLNRWLSERRHTDGHKEIEWLRPDGQPMTVEDWHDDSRHCLAVTGGDQTSRLLALFNAETAAVEFTLPEGAWRLEVDSAEPARAAGQPFDRTCTVQPLSVVILASAPRRS